MKDVPNSTERTLEAKDEEHVEENIEYLLSNKESFGVYIAKGYTSFTTFGSCEGGALAVAYILNTRYAQTQET